MTKQLTEEKVERRPQKSADDPTSQQRRKHQITYLAHQVSRPTAGCSSTACLSLEREYDRWRGKSERSIGSRRERGLMFLSIINAHQCM